MALKVAGEWVRTSWAYQPTVLSHTGSTIVKALHSALTQAGWELSSWSGTVDDRHYLRADRRFLNITNDANGTAGNVALAKTGANVTVSGMTGGSPSAPATGYVELVAQPSDGDTVTVSDGTTSVVFEFDNNASVGGGNISVTIGSKVSSTIDNLMTAINAQGFNVTASLVSDLWRFNGDALEQNCGIHVFWNSGSARIEVSAFLENTGGTASQVETPTSVYSNNQKVFITYNNSLQNDFIIYCGEDGFYVEVGSNGTPQNIAHGYIAAFDVIPEFQGTKDEQRKWTAQGLSLDLFGSLKFSEDRNYRLVGNAGDNKNYTGRLAPTVPRGTNSVLASSQADGRAYYIGPKDNWIGFRGGTQTINTLPWWCAFGVLNSPADDRYKISQVWMQQHLATVDAGVSSTSASNNVAAAGSTFMIEPRWLRMVKRLAVVDGSLTPYINITDQVTNTIYRVSRVADNGRNANIGIEYPSGTVTIPTTPTV